MSRALVIAAGMWAILNLAFANLDGIALWVNFACAVLALGLLGPNDRR